MAQYPGHMFAPAECAAFGTPHMSDPAFEPHSNFDFEDGAHSFGDLDHAMASMHTFGGETSSQSVYGETSKIQTNGLGHAPGDEFDPEPMSACDIWTADHDALGIGPRPGQTDIATKRSDSVSRHFGQLTPPDDEALSASLLSPSQEGSGRAFSDQLMPANSKSERARNAANQRHAKAKKVKLESQVDALSPQSDEAGSSEDRREKYREKNRLAAAKCRAKKKTTVEDLEDRARHASARNSQLKLQARELRDAFTELRSHALMHDPSQGCRCSQIHLYNANKAQETARGAITLPVFLSASMQGHDAFGMMGGGPSFDGSDHAARAHSFSVPNRTCAVHPHHARSQSFVDMSPFLPDPSADGMGQDKGALSDISFDEE